MQRAGPFVTVLDKIAVINDGLGMTLYGVVMDIRGVRSDVCYNYYIFGF